MHSSSSRPFKCGNQRQFFRDVLQAENTYNKYKQSCGCSGTRTAKPNQATNTTAEPPYTSTSSSSGFHEPNLGLAKDQSSLVLRLLVGNIQGLYPETNQSKLPFLRELSSGKNFMIIALTETHLSEGVREAEINILNYTPFQTDRKAKTHGGTITYMRNDIALSANKALSYSDGQAFPIQVCNMIFVNCYRPPHCCPNNFNRAMEGLRQLLVSLSIPAPEIILTGD
ncbi:hypothetical protein E2C01_036911 [Portunus trituberculatus]|uniref:Endonuclease/exonuclease/phosphatase domain-containing protein n=1 Tax=Portunus trituberculatus TaxID=210409 RepID=A0A5B7FDY7_PORTR|nr:hypothetical protein [Portunus trituberculatus]